LAKKNPAAVGPDTGLRTTSFASTSVVKAQWPSSLPLTRRADSQQPTCQSGGLQRRRR
jgi:hypothetical protein